MTPIGVFNQPPENFSAWKARGCNFVTGPDASDRARMQVETWANKAASAGLEVAGNFNYRPDNLMAWYVPVDEPNEHQTLLSLVRASVDKFTAIDAGYAKPLPILISIGGDKITSGDKPDYYQQLAALSPNIVFVVDWYCANRNPTTYLQTPQFSMGLNGEAVKKLIGWTGRKVWSFIECSWQRLDTQPLGREPTADEMEMQIGQSLAAGSEGIIYFATATGNRGATPISWPARYDPPVNPAIPERQKAIAARLNPPAPIPPTPAPPAVVVPPIEEIYRRLQAMEAWQARVQAK